MVSIRLVWIERNVLVGLVPHPLRPSTKPLAMISAALVVDRMAMAGSGELDSQKVEMPVVDVGVLMRIANPWAH